MAEILEELFHFTDNPNSVFKLLLVSITALFCFVLSAPEYVQLMPDFYPAIKMEEKQVLICELSIEIFCNLIQRFI